MGDESREYTNEEAREMLMDSLEGAVHYCNSLKDKTTEEKLRLLVFNILCIVDGVGADSVGYELVPSPHPDDKQFHIDEGDNYYPEAKVEGGLDVFCGGMLHNVWVNRRRDDKA